LRACLKGKRKKVKGKNLELWLMKDIRERTFDFALRIVKLCQELDSQPGVGRTIGRQLLRSGTSIGANMEEAQAGQSKLDFISKNAIALKEARETIFWVRLLAASEIIPAGRLSELQSEAEEISKIIGSIIVTAKRRK
jgi:four helix bundle protein